MKKAEHKKIANKMFIVVFAMYILSVVIGGAGFFLITSNMKVKNILIFAVAGIVVLTAVAAFVARFATRGAGKLVKKLEERNSWFENIVDAVPYPIHVTDNDMNWVFMNKAFEKELEKGGVPYDRFSGAGHACSNANATICNTEGCGIKQMLKGNNESYFDWHGYSMKQSTAPLTDAEGNNIGYVEVVTDLTNIMRLNEFYKSEMTRTAKNLSLLANGDLNLDLAIGESNEYTKEAHTMIEAIDRNFEEVKDALARMVADADMLTSEAVEGNLKVRADADNHKGEYANIIAGFNATLDAIIKPVKTASHAIERLARGEQLEYTENDYKGDMKRLVDDTKILYAALETMLTQVNRGVEAISNGDISYRCDKSELKGMYAVFTDKVNNLFDVLSIPLKESQDVLGKISVNDYTQSIQGEYKGIFKELADSINGTITRLDSLQDAVIRTGKGDLTRLDEFKSVGKRSENDHIMPAFIDTYQSIQDLIDEVNALTAAASEGRLVERGEPDKFEGGYRQIIEGLNATMDAIVAPASETVEVLTKFADGDLTIKMNGNYMGDFLKIKESINNAIESFNQMLTNINVSAAQVAGGSRQVSDSAQNLSMGSTEQASAIEQLTASLEVVSSQTRLNAENANQANSLAANAKESAAKGNSQMQNMLGAMNDISASSTNISKIIKVIDDIAFQTNILALNAAVEAARAGQYGKGFAVVAEEVRNLAAKSAEAAKDTTALIEGSIEKIEGGTKMADSTARALNEIQQSIDKVAELVNNISVSSNEQATGITQVSQGIAQISQVTQTNSATAEESAAASEELSGQAEMLRQLVNKYELTKSEAGSVKSLPATEQRRAIAPPARQAAVSRPHAVRAPQVPGKKPSIGLPEDDFGKY